MKAVLLSGILASLVVASALSSQSRSWEIGALAGGGPSVVTASLGGVADRQLFVTTVFVTRPLVRLGPLSASYLGEVMPLVVATKVPNSLFDDGPDLGAGIAPVGLRFAVQLISRVSIFAEGNGGAVAFARAMPYRGARSLNFLGSAGAGLRLGQRAHRSYIVAYRFTHISNANTAPENPGFNAHVFYLGITLH